MDIHDLTDFFRLSALLNLQLSATSVGRSNTLSIILGRKSLPREETALLLKVLEYLDEAYGERRRRVGPLAVLHPLRASALLASALERPSTLDVLSELLHDKLEDITPDSIGPARWAEVEERFQSLLETIDPADEWYLMERLDWLTRRDGEPYFQYIGRLLDNSDRAPSLVAVKLADRLDNTLDMRIAVEDPIERVDFFQTLFQVLFVNSFRGYEPDLPHPPASPLRGAHRLYQLFKNAVLLSLIRQKCKGPHAPGTEVLFTGLTMASMKEAQRTALHIFGYHKTDVAAQRELLMDVMGYVQEGGVDRVTLPDAGSRLDGLFGTRFDDSDTELRLERLEELNEDKDLMVQASVAFIVIFLRFLEDPSYWVSGVSEEGITAAR